MLTVIPSRCGLILRMGFSAPSTDFNSQRQQLALFGNDPAVADEMDFLFESARQTRKTGERQANSVAREAKRVREDNILKSLKSGVAFSGSVIEVANETVRLAGEEIASIIEAANFQATQQERQAYNVERSARANFLQATLNLNNTEAREKVNRLSQPNPFISFLSSFGRSLSSSGGGKGGGGSSGLISLGGNSDPFSYPSLRTTVDPFNYGGGL